ncbi:hypothetical protein STEG23_020755 [Scotinomys teguina]
MENEADGQEAQSWKALARQSHLDCVPQATVENNGLEDCAGWFQQSVQTGKPRKVSMDEWLDQRTVRPHISPHQPTSAPHQPTSAHISPTFLLPLKSVC